MQIFTILAVDDEPFNLDLIEAAFHNYNNVKIEYAQGGQATLTLLKIKF